MFAVSFALAARISSVLSLGVAVLYLVRPELPLLVLGQVPDGISEFGFQRAGALFGGLAAMFWHARKVHARRAQIAMASGFAVALVLLAATSTSLWLRELADGRMILLSGFELLWAAMLLSSMRYKSNQPHNRTP